MHLQIGFLAAVAASWMSYRAFMCTGTLPALLMTCNVTLLCSD